MKDRSISLLGLVAEILLHWRGILVCMLIGGVALGGFSIARNYLGASNQENTTTTVQEDLVAQQENLTIIDKENVELVVNYESFIEKFNDSILMSIDPQNVHMSKLIFMVSSDNYDKSYAIERLYEGKLINELHQWIVDNSLEELTMLDAETLVYLSKVSQNDLAFTDSFRVEIVHRTEEECLELTQLVIDYINEQYNAIEQIVGEHSIEVASQVYMVQTDWDIMTRQLNSLNVINNYQKYVDDNKPNFSDEQNAYYNFLVGDETDEEQSLDMQAGTTTVIPSNMLIYAIIGMVLFAFVYVFYIFMKYIMDKNININDDTKELFGISQIGRIAKQSPKKRMFSGLDRLIWKICSRSNSNYTEDELLLNAVASIKVMAKRNNLDAIYCVGCKEVTTLEGVSQKIKDELQKDNITMIELNDLLYSRAAIEQLQEAYTVFLLKKAGVSSYEEIYKEIDFLQEQNIKIVGAIVVE